jgi:hypothetical protein
MAFGWTTKRVLIVVKTYPTPAYKGVEVSCRAAVGFGVIGHQSSIGSLQ